MLLHPGESIFIPLTHSNQLGVARGEGVYPAFYPLTSSKDRDPYKVYSSTICTGLGDILVQELIFADKN